MRMMISYSTVFRKSGVCVSDNTSYLNWCLCGGYGVVCMDVSVYRRRLEETVMLCAICIENFMFRVPMTAFPLLIFFGVLIILFFV
jgi:hypothetical protein